MSRLSEIQQMLERARAEEREKCAKIAETSAHEIQAEGYVPDPDYCDHCETALRIAAKIRSSK